MFAKITFSTKLKSQDFCLDLGPVDALCAAQRAGDICQGYLIGVGLQAKVRAITESRPRGLNAQTPFEIGLALSTKP